MEEFDKKSAIRYLIVSLIVFILPAIILVEIKSFMFSNDPRTWVHVYYSGYLYFSLYGLMIYTAFCIPVMYILFKNIKRFIKAIKNKKALYSLISILTIIVLIFSLYGDMRNIARYYSYIITNYNVSDEVKLPFP